MRRNTEIEQRERIVTGIMHRPESITYYLSINECENCHFSIEITRHKDILKQLDINNSSYEN